MTYFKFAKLKNGIGAFAAIAVETIDGVSGVIEWSPSEKALQKNYGEAVSNGIEDAVAWHVLEGGQTKSFRILQFEYLVMDTTLDAVRCAATMAAWKSLGHDEAQIVFEYDGEWKARRK